VLGAPLSVYSSSIPSGNLIVCSVKFAIDTAMRENVEMRLVLNTRTPRRLLLITQPSGR
jgi:hypothetical protein